VSRQARECLDEAKQIARLPLPRVAAREAYLAANYATKGNIFEHTGRTVKTHRGLRTAFSHLRATSAVAIAQIVQKGDRSLEPAGNLTNVG
jgi:uncharacterized protein (UPF0332 family)